MGQMANMDRASRFMEAFEKQICEEGTLGKLIGKSFTLKSVELCPLPCSEDVAVWYQFVDEEGNELLPLTSGDVVFDPEYDYTTDELVDEIMSHLDIDTFSESDEAQLCGSIIAALDEADLP